jgi:hypothetical protein
MRNLFVTLFILNLSFVSCKKEKLSSADKAVIGQWEWIVQYSDGGPGHTLTPQNTGIQETLALNNDHSWSVIQNNLIVRSGSFKTSIQTNRRDEKVNSIHYYSNRNNSDSVSYFKVYNDTLMFSTDLMGSIGGGTRYYSRQ